MASFSASIFFNINYFLTFSLSLGFNATLLYLIKSNTSTKFKKYSSILLQGVVLDIATSSVYCISQSYYECTRGYIFYVSIAPWSSFFDEYIKCKWVIPLTIFSVSCNFSNPIQAFYRYLHFCLFTTLKPIHIFGIYCIGFACVAVLATMHVLPYEDINLMPDALEIITTIAYWRDHKEDLTNFCAGRLLNLYIVFSIIGMLLIINSCGILLMYFNNRVNSYLKNSQVHMISKTIQAQQQISRQLMYQFCLPGIVGSVSIVCATCLILLPEYSGGIVMLLFVPFHWIPVLNPVITILCINDYRRQVFRFWKPATVRNGSTVVAPTATGNVESKVYYTGTVSLVH